MSANQRVGERELVTLNSTCPGTCAFSRFCYFLSVGLLVSLPMLLFSESVPAESNVELQRLIQQSQQSRVQLPLPLLSNIHRLQQLDGQQAPPGQIAHYQRWLEWLEKNPSRLGSSRFVNEPLIVGALVNIKQTYHVGTNIRPGGGIMLAKHWQHPVELQSDSSSQDNYVRISADRSSVRFSRSSDIKTGVYGGLDARQTLPFFPVVSGQLVAGDSVTVEYRNLRLPTFATESFVLPLFFKTGSDTDYFQAPLKQLQIAAGEVKNIDVIVPSRISPGQPFDTKVLLKDEYGNPSAGRSPSFDVLVNGVYYGRIPAGESNSQEIVGLVLESSGEHKIEVRSSGGGIVKHANPFVVSDGNQNIRWGETHQHSSLGEGVSGIHDRNAEQGLDFAIAAVHAGFLNDNKWQGLPQPKAWVWGNARKTGGQQVVISNQYFTDIPVQSDLIRRLTPGSNTLIALPESPVDDRFLDNQMTRLVEIVSRNSHFEWYANRLLSRGYRLGFTGSNHSHLLPLGHGKRTALTAVVVENNEQWFDAMVRGSTYVTTGERTYLKVALNGAGPGSRIRSAQRRVISGEVRASSAVHRVELVKNGEVIDSRNLAFDPQSSTLKVSFYSDSYPAMQQRDLPRNGREWIGFIQTTDSQIFSFDAPGFRNPARQALAMNPKIMNRIDFITWTRGNSSSFLLEINTNNEDAIFELNLRDGHEDVEVSPETRSSSPISRSRHRVSLYDLQNNPVVRTINVGGYEDKVTFELVNHNADRNVAFEFVDQTTPREGDYYYVRVSQIDDQMAWSSPIFVGGEDHP